MALPGGVSAQPPLSQALYSQQVSHGMGGAALLGTVLKTSTGQPAILGAVVNKPEHQVLSGLQAESAGLVRAEAWGSSATLNPQGVWEQLWSEVQSCQDRPVSFQEQPD